MHLRKMRICVEFIVRRDFGVSTLAGGLTILRSGDVLGNNLDTPILG